MKILLKTLLLIITANIISNAQTVKDCNIYPTNLEENMYFASYDDASKTIKGMYFMVLSDGDNSKFITNEFTVKIYLYQQGKDPIFIKTFEEPGIYHMGSKEYKLDLSFSDVNVAPGTYRVGVFVNADKTVKEDPSDNAILFRTPITVKNGNTASKAKPAATTEDE